MAQIELVPTIALLSITNRLCPGDWAFCPVCGKSMRWDGERWSLIATNELHYHRLRTELFADDPVAPIDDEPAAAPVAPTVKKEPVDPVGGTGIEVALWPHSSRPNL